MSSELAAICTNLMSLAGKAAADQQPLIAELAKEVHRICLVIQHLENGGNGNEKSRKKRSGH
ncbi:MAG TPA: hypothetical protein VGH74_05480 [Planctomycetaceae bacterium]